MLVSDEQFCMKNFIVIILFLALFANVSAQNKLIMADLEVKDSSGTIYPLAIWQKLIMSGKYSINMLPGGKTAMLSRLSAEETERMFAKMPKPPESKFFITGEKISSFSERDMNGNKFNLKELTGKVVVLNFWFINCGPCRQEMPQLNELVETYKSNTNVVFLAVSLDPKYDIKEFLKTNPFSYNIIDNGRYIASKYNVTSYPTHAVLDKQGKVIFHTSGLGMSTVPWVKKSIEAALHDAVPL